MRKEYKEVEEISWDSIFSCWEGYSHTYEPKLLTGFSIERINVNLEIPNYYLQGYDWIEKDDYEERIKYITNKPREFLYFGPCLNKGTLHTLRILDKARDSIQDCAAIWLAAFTKDIISISLPYEWRGKGFSILEKVYFESLGQLKEKYMNWHHAMRELVPTIYFSSTFLEGITINSYQQIVELSVINSAFILNNYIAIEYVIE